MSAIRGQLSCLACTHGREVQHMFLARGPDSLLNPFKFHTEGSCGASGESCWYLGQVATTLPVAKGRPWGETWLLQKV
jgi:hypothetical protein